MQPQARAALLRSGLFAALAFVADGVGHGVRLVEDDDAVEIRSQPVDDLRETRGFQRPVAALTLVRAQRRIGREQNSLGELDRRSLLEARLRHDLKLFLAQRRPVALRVLEQLVGFRNPQRLAAALEPIVQDDAGNLAALSGAGAVAEIKAAAEAHCFFGVVRGDRNEVEQLVDEERPGEMYGMGFAGIDHALELGVGQEPELDRGLRQMRPIERFRRRDGGHGGGLHERRGMRLRALDRDRLHRIGLIEPGAERVASWRFPIRGS